KVSNNPLGGCCHDPHGGHGQEVTGGELKVDDQSRRVRSADANGIEGFWRNVGRILGVDDVRATNDQRSNHAAVVGTETGITGALDGVDKIISRQESRLLAGDLTVLIEDRAVYLCRLTGYGVVIDPGDIIADGEGVGQPVFTDFPLSGALGNDLGRYRIVVGQVYEQVLDVVDRRHVRRFLRIESRNVTG